MYSIRQLVKGDRQPRRGLLELNRLYHRQLRGRTGVDVIEQDWDNLVILDACRYDLFEEVNTLDGELSAVISRGSSTGEFFRENFASRRFPTIVYVCANPQLQARGLRGRFHADRPLWIDHWDDDRTVRPAAVTREALAAAEEFPTKRLIVHYLQPHYPFIGETGRRIEHGTIAASGVISDVRETPSIWRRLEEGDVDVDTVRQAYRENLELTLPHLERLVENLPGKTVVTSDHGNAFGEWGVYGHPSMYYLESLVRVPWLVAPWTERKRVVAGDVDGPARDGRDGDVSERLVQLGYLDRA